MNNDIPISPDELADMVCIVSTSGYKQGTRAWDELSIWYRNGHSNPFVSITECKVFDGEVNRNPDRFKAVISSKFDQAVFAFESSELQPQLLKFCPRDVAKRFPDGSTSQMQNAAERQVTPSFAGGPTLSAALCWLYPDLADGTEELLVAAFERDFGIASQIASNIFASERSRQETPSWVKAFAEALRYFDRKAWEMRS